MKTRKHRTAWVLLIVCIVSWLAQCEPAAIGSAAEPPITALTFSPDGDSVIAVSQRGIGIHQWPSLRRLEQRDPTMGNLHDLSLAADGGRLAIAGGSPTESGVVEIRPWPLADSIKTLVGHTDSVMAIEWVGPTSLASASLDHQVMIWNTGSGEVLRILSGHSKGVTSLCWLAKEKLLVSAGIDQNLRVWDVQSGELLRSLHNHTSAVHDLATRPGDQAVSMVASVSADKTIRLWQPSIGRMVRFIRLNSEPLAVAWLTDGSAIVVACDDGHVRLIDPDTVEILEQLPGIDGWAYSIAVHPRDGSIVVGGTHGQLQRLTFSMKAEQR
jgi:WD40 repeat protein